MVPPPVNLTRDPLQTLRVEAIAYGAKDTGEMGGGAAASVLWAAGPELLTALKSKLAKSARTIGEVVVTDSFGLHKSGIRWIVHLISIIKHTPQGAYCPHPERLQDGVEKGYRVSVPRIEDSMKAPQPAGEVARDIQDQDAVLRGHGLVKRVKCHRT